MSAACAVTGEWSNGGFGTVRRRRRGQHRTPRTRARIDAPPPNNRARRPSRSTSSCPSTTRRTSWPNVSRRCASTWTSRCRSALSSRSLTTAAPTAPRSVARRLAATVEGVQAMTLHRKGRGYALRQRLGGEHCRGRRLHGRRPVDLPHGLMPLVASVLSGHGDVAVGTRLARGRPGGARAQAGADLAGVQPPRAYVPAEPDQRLPVRLQSAAPRACARAAPPRGGQRLVLRHRAPRNGRTPRDARQRDPGRVGGRPRLARRHRVDGAGRP